MQTSLVTGHFHGYASGQMELTAGTSHKQRWGQSCTCMSDCCSALTSELHPLEKMRNPGSSCMLRLLRFLTLRVYASKSRLWYFVFSLFGRKSWFSSEKQSLCFFFLCWFLFGQKARNLRLIIARMMPGHPMKAACNDVSKVRWTTLRASCLKTKRFRNYLYTTVSLFNQLNEKYRKSLPAAHSVILYLAWLCVSKLAGRNIYFILNTYIEWIVLCAP